MWVELGTLSIVVWDNEVGDRETGMGKDRDPAVLLMYTLNLEAGLP